MSLIFYFDNIFVRGGEKNTYKMRGGNFYLNIGLTSCTFPSAVFFPDLTFEPAAGAVESMLKVAQHQKIMKRTNWKKGLGGLSTNGWKWEYISLGNLL